MSSVSERFFTYFRSLHPHLNRIVDELCDTVWDEIINYICDNRVFFFEKNTMKLRSRKNDMYLLANCVF